LLRQPQKERKKERKERKELFSMQRRPSVIREFKDGKRNGRMITKRKPQCLRVVLFAVMSSLSMVEMTMRYANGEVNEGEFKDDKPMD